MSTMLVNMPQAHRRLAEEPARAITGPGLYKMLEVDWAKAPMEKAQARVTSTLKGHIRSCPLQKGWLQDRFHATPSTRSGRQGTATVGTGRDDQPQHDDEIR